MTKRNMAVFIEGGVKKVKLRHPFLTKEGSTIAVKQASVFWKFRNVTSDNNKLTLLKPADVGAGEEKTVQEGYWDFHLLKERLAGESITLTPDVYDNTCRAKLELATGDVVNMKKFGELLGFPEDHILRNGVEVKSQQPVDVNRGLRYLEIECDLIDSSQGIGTDGGASSVLTRLPITPGTRLNSSVSEYGNSYPPILTKTTIVSEMVFTVKSNVNITVDADVFLNIVIDGIE